MRAKIKRISGYGKTKCIDSLMMRAQNQQDLLQSFSLNKPFIVSANRLSYGDCALADTSIDLSFLNRFINIEESSQCFEVEPQVTFLDTLKITHNRQLPVFPGTLHASIAGGVANDIHGKNHCHQGSFGNHIASIELCLPQGRITASKNENTKLFYATIGGLGLTGIISKITIQTVPKAQTLQVEKTCFNHIETGLSLLQKHALTSTYSALWCDIFRKGRGVMLKANPVLAGYEKLSHATITIPSRIPFSLVSQPLMKLFNRHYDQRQLSGARKFKQHLMDFNNPLDRIKNFNHLYGPKGFYQLQCVVPDDKALDFAKLCLNVFNQKNSYPTLAVIKKLGSEGVGLLSFAKKGVTFAFDFMAKDQDIVLYLQEALTDYDGRVYLAKDQLLSAANFKRMYPSHEVFKEVLEQYQLHDVFQSAMSKRLGIHS